MKKPQQEKAQALATVDLAGKDVISHQDLVNSHANQNQQYRNHLKQASQTSHPAHKTTLIQSQGQSSLGHTGVHQ